MQCVLLELHRGSGDSKVVTLHISVLQIDWVNGQNWVQRRGRRIGMFYYVFYEGAHAGMRKRRHAKKKFWTPCSAEGLRRACGGPADSLTAHRALRGPRGHAKKKARLSDFTLIECSVDIFSIRKAVW